MFNKINGAVQDGSMVQQEDNMALMHSKDYSIQHGSNVYEEYWNTTRL